MKLGRDLKFKGLASVQRDGQAIYKALKVQIGAGLHPVLRDIGKADPLCPILARDRVAPDQPVTPAQFKGIDEIGIRNHLGDDDLRIPAFVAKNNQVVEPICSQRPVTPDQDVLFVVFKPRPELGQAGRGPRDFDQVEPGHVPGIGRQVPCVVQQHPRHTRLGRVGKARSVQHRVTMVGLVGHGLRRHLMPSVT